MSKYEVRIEFVKEFVCGHLYGCEIRESMQFVDIASACDWVEGVNKNKNVDYIVKDVNYIAQNIKSGVRIND